MVTQLTEANITSPPSLMLLLSKTNNLSLIIQVFFSIHQEENF